MNDSLLRTSLLDLLHAFGNDANGLLLGGGYGLYLKQLHLAGAGVRTLIGAELWPAPRATQDLDLMLSAELVADARSMTALRAALDKLDYQVIQGSEYLQFVRTITATQFVKVDLLTAQLDVLENFPAINADIRRATPTAADRPKLHAHPTDGALTLTEAPLVIKITGTLSNGQAFAHLCAGARNGGSVIDGGEKTGRCVKPTPWAEPDQSIDTPASISLTPKKDQSRPLGVGLRPASQSKKDPRMDGSVHASITNHHATPPHPFSTFCRSSRMASTAARVQACQSLPYCWR